MEGRDARLGILVHDIGHDEGAAKTYQQNKTEKVVLNTRLRRHVISVRTRASTRKADAKKAEVECEGRVRCEAKTREGTTTSMWVKSLSDTTYRMTL